MDLSRIIHDLRVQKQEIERAIARLEQLQRSAHEGGPLPRRRGRKSMGPEERRKVSERIRKYWAAKRLVRPTETSS